MNIDLNKYIAHVLRSGVNNRPQSEIKERETSINPPVSTSEGERFVFASKYSLRLDEIA